MPSWMPKRAVWLPAALTAAVLLAGCRQPEQFAPACPVLKMLQDAADLTQFNGHGQDVIDTVLVARIDALPAVCKSGPRGIVEATLNVQMVVTRGPALQGRDAQVPYFIAVMDGDRMVQQKDYLMPVSYPPNVDRGRATSEDIYMEFPVTPQKSAAAYTIYVGLRLTAEQLQYNRRNPPP